MLKVDKTETPDLNTHAQNRASHIPPIPFPKILEQWISRKEISSPPTVQNKESTAAVTKITIQIIQSGFFFGPIMLQIFLYKVKKQLYLSLTSEVGHGMAGAHTVTI